MAKAHRVHIAGLVRDLPLLEVAPGVNIAVFNMLGDTEIVEACAQALAQRAPANIQTLVTAEAKSIPLTHALAVRLGIPYVVLRKSWKPYMGETLTSLTRSITTGHEQTLHLDEKDQSLVAERRVAIIDDVISTGSTLHGIRAILDKSNADIISTLAVFTEGEPRDDVIALGHLPIIRE